MKPKDRDFVETREGMFFCVAGYLHPADRVTAYLKYVPTAEGKWGRGGTRYTRTLDYYHVSQVENTYRYLSENHLRYLYDCPVRNIQLSAVPYTDIETYYHPTERLGSIMTNPRDPLEEKAAAVARLLGEHVDPGCLGVTGSLLLGSHNPAFSDIDLTVYGRDNAELVREAVLEAKRSGEFRFYTEDEALDWCSKRAQIFPLSVEELRRVLDRRWNFGYVQGTYMSIHPTRSDPEITEAYGDYTYRKQGEVHGTATVTDTRESIYLPAVIHVEDSQLEDLDVDVSMIVSYEGLYCDLFEPGENVEFRGSLEKVSGKKGFTRVVLGGAGSTGGYVKWV